MKINNLGKKKTILNDFISQIRDINIQNDSLRFRRNIERIGEIFAYEISKELDYIEKNVSTPFEKFTQLLIEKKPVLITLLRAGLPFQQGFLNYFDDSNCAFISAYRHNTDAHNFDIKMEYVSMPCIDDRVVIISDPMIASGNSMVLALEEILKRGTPKHIHIAGIIVSSKGKNYLEEHITFKNCTLWLGAEDRKLNKNSYIIPGLGDAGDLAYGKKK